MYNPTHTDLVGKVHIPNMVACTKCNFTVDSRDIVTEAVFDGATGYVLNVVCRECRDKEWCDTVSWNG